MSSRKILPTKINLISLRRNIRFVRSIKRLLESKREVLLLYLRNFALEYERYYNEVNKTLSSTYSTYMEAIVAEGTQRVESFAKSTPSSLNVNTSVRSVFGVRIPVLQVDMSSVPSRFFSAVEVSPELTEAQQEIKESIDKVIKLAELEATIRLLVVELRKTQRLINAIDYSILPSYMNSLKYVRMVLEDRQREEFVRLKFVRNILERRRQSERAGLPLNAGEQVKR